jgi:hypothetical protein
LALGPALRLFGRGGIRLDSTRLREVVEADEGWPASSGSIKS